jgi:hypothetical protein
MIVHATIYLYHSTMPIRHFQILAANVRIYVNVDTPVFTSVQYFTQAVRPFTSYLP